MAHHYSEEFKNCILKKLFVTNPPSINSLANKEGLPMSTVHTWYKKANAAGMLSRDNNDASVKKSTDFSPEEKFAIINEANALSEDQLGAFCRTKGIYSHELFQWRNNAIDSLSSKKVKIDPRIKQLEKEKQQLSRELHRKEKALAETAALLVLKKKWDTFLEEKEGHT